MHTTMNVTGRPAQFGRGVMVEVGGKLVEQFARNLSELISSEGTAAADGAAGAGDGAAADSAGAGAAAAEATGPGSTQPSPTISVASTPSAPPAQASEDSINLVRLVGPAILKRVVPVVLAAIGLALLGRRFRNRSRRGAES
jgi:uncharacterized protein